MRQRERPANGGESSGSTMGGMAAQAPALKEAAAVASESMASGCTASAAGAAIGSPAAPPEGGNGSGLTSPVGVIPAEPSRQQLRLRSIGWALTAALAALLLGLPLGLEPALRAGGCGLFYGLLAFHLQRVDPDDGHLQAGLVGAVCGIHSLGLPPLASWPPAQPWPASLLAVAPTVMMELIRAWLPLIGAALLLHGSRLVAHRVPSARRP